MDQSLTSRSIPADQVTAIEGFVDKARHDASVAMEFRITGFDLSLSVTQREAVMVEQMIEAVNLSAQLEERLVGLMAIQQLLNKDWDQIEAEALDNYAKRYTDKKGKLADPIKNHHTLWLLKGEVDNTCEILKRVIDRLTSMQWVARSASSASQGMM